MFYNFAEWQQLDLSIFAKTVHWSEIFQKYTYLFEILSGESLSGLPNKTKITNEQNVFHSFLKNFPSIKNCDSRTQHEFIKKCSKINNEN